jgi:general stress protein 13
MTSKIEVDQIIEGKVTGIQPYGAFVALNDEVQGLVHISEVTHGYVKDINEHLTVGDDVNVKVLNIDEKNNKVSLSIRATEEAPKQQKQAPRKQTTVIHQQQGDGSAGFNSLKEKLEEWLEQSKTR